MRLQVSVHKSNGSYKIKNKQIMEKSAHKKIICAFDQVNAGLSRAAAKVRLKLKPRPGRGSVG